MEVGTLVRVPDAPQAAPDQGGYKIPVSIKGGTYWALVDSSLHEPTLSSSFHITNFVTLYKLRN